MLIELGRKNALQKQVVIGIDFGKFGTVYAIQFRDDYLRDRQTMYYDPYYYEHQKKQPTCVLISKKYRQEAVFGAKAETLYSKVRKAEDWYYFRNFKMQLYNKGNKRLTNKTEIVGDRGDTLPVEDVFSASLRCIKQTVDDLLDKDGNFRRTEKQWVITIPAIWDDTAKQIMRDSASMAGMSGPYSSVAIVLEPEAAAIYYAVSEAKTVDSSQECEEIVLDVGPWTATIVVDIGGETVDISAMVFEEYGIKQIHEPLCGPYGGDVVNEKLIELISKIFKKSDWDHFARESNPAYKRFRSSIETAKREVKPDRNYSKYIRDDFNIELPESILRNFAWEKGVGLEAALADVRINDKTGCLRLHEGSVVVDSDVLRHIMKAPVKEILKCITKVVSDVMLCGRRIHAVILVGGFAMSEFLYDEIDKRMNEFNITVKRPMSCIFAVLRGAVLYGQNERVVSNTFRKEAHRPFAVDDPIDRQEKNKEKYYARGCFSKHVTSNQEVGIDQWLATPLSFMYL